MEDSVYHNKYAVRGAIGYAKCMNKLDKNKEKEVAAFKPELEKYY